MSTLAVEIHDAGLRARGDGSRGEPPPSPGYAVLDGDALLTGAEAAAIARLKPRRVNNRFWSELDAPPPLPHPFPPGLGHGDLAHAHLARFWAAVGSGIDAVILAVPGSHSEHQLGLTLGIARECGMPVVGLVDAAVAASAGGHPNRRLLHVDVQLHRTVVTELTQGAELIRRRVEIGDRAGLISLHDAWAKWVAATFVRRTRFDPLHSAETEQALYGRLPRILDRLSSREEAAELEMEAPGRVHSVELTRAQTAAAVASEYDAILQLIRLLKPPREPATVLLSDRAASLPGLQERAAGIGEADVVALPAGAALDGALRHQAAIRSAGEALPFVTQLPLDRKSVEPARDLRPRAATPAGPGPRPTHLVHDGRGYSISTRPLVVGISIPDGSRGINLKGETAGISRRHCSVYRRGERILVEDHSAHGSFLNGQRIERIAELVAGDRLRLGIPGIELELITMVETDGPAQN